MTMLILAKRVLVAASIAAWPLACGGSDASNSGSNSSGACIEGATQACECEPGVTGAQTCDAAGSFGECDCSPCGNDVLDMGEQCDGANVNGETCASATMNARPQGTLSCSDTCQFNVTACTAPPTTTGGAGGVGGTTPTGGAGGTGATMGSGATTGAGGLMGAGGGGI